MRVQIDNLSKNFGSRRVLEAIDLEVEPGEFVAVIGRSGCGKSTLLKLVAGLDLPTTGSIHLDGRLLKAPDPNVRVMFQDERLLLWKRVIDNVALGLKGEASERARWALEQVGLAERAGDWPRMLSGGQRQRVALARALASEPQLLLLDEPLGALDALTRLEMQKLIEDLWLERRFTALLVTHDVQEAVALCDRIVLIEQGRLALDQSVDLPRPRLRSSAAFAELVGDILDRVLGGNGPLPARTDRPVPQGSEIP
ncbi:ABC transporter ATP-binding protein [Gloeobacter kilaueensis]|uniref:Aliphatic sulfonates transport ATP-binding subunit n=1 Tax=Gloeobacter kilaueensis (strain ATCC BAA-2537 / CCAP 1431/1 / ULC 316 / JS1) TaxID=1183438 RepID=U5QNV1_GLOK1|nr:ATP-binding cassette domain-containing protein [Gloeobacter kilaueensis]AGY60616.1 aliphatic sulfonates transport ATP-binding subunit [Gloeobacter kilaueensis JS1]